MKKIFSLLFIIAMFGVLTPSYSADQPQTIMRPSKEQVRKEFEQRLNLNEKQKEKARVLHKQGQEQMKPVIMQIEVKRQEIETIKLSRIAPRAQQEKISQLNSEIRELEKQAQEIRKKNTREFEKILNKKQLAELEKMKTEGRMRYEKHHQPHPPFNGLGTPNFLLRPILPPTGSENRLWK